MWSQREGKCKIILGVGVVRESYFASLGEKLQIILMVEASLRELLRLFFFFFFFFFPPLRPMIPVGGGRVGQRMVRRPLEPPKGTCEVESVKAALPHPDSFFLALAFLVWD